MSATSRICLAALLLCATAACTAKDITGNGTRNISVSSVSTSPSPTTVSLLGRVTDAATSAGVGGATLSIADGPNDGKSTTSDFGGNYAFLGLDPSDFRVTITAARYVTQTKHVTLTANETLEFQLVKAP